MWVWCRSSKNREQILVLPDHACGLGEASWPLESEPQDALQLMALRTSSLKDHTPRVRWGRVHKPLRWDLETQSRVRIPSCLRQGVNGGAHPHAEGHCPGKVAPQRVPGSQAGPRLSAEIFGGSYFHDLSGEGALGTEMVSPQKWRQDFTGRKLVSIRFSFMKWPLKKVLKCEKQDLDFLNCAIPTFT